MLLRFATRCRQRVPRHRPDAVILIPAEAGELPRPGAAWFDRERSFPRVRRRSLCTRLFLPNSGPEHHVRDPLSLSTDAPVFGAGWEPRAAARWVKSLISGASVLCLDKDSRVG